MQLSTSSVPGATRPPIRKKMGVWGLLSFVQMHNPPLGQQISFTHTHDVEREPPPIIVIDGNALAYHLFQHCEECCWWDGGELRDFEASVRRWINEVQGSGIRLRCVLDGMLDPLKEETAVIRGRENAMKVEATLSKLSACRGNYGALGVEGFVLPLGCIEIVASVLVSEGVPTRRAMYEADGELALECCEWKALGVLSNDSDFICMRIPLLPLNEFRVAHAVVTAVVYQPHAVAECISLGIEELPILACMCGNDFVPREMLEGLHASIAPGSRPNKAWQVIRGSAKLIREVCGTSGVDAQANREKLITGMLVGKDEGREGALAALTTVIEAALVRYSSHLSTADESRGYGADGAEDSAWLDRELLSVRLSPNSLQQGRHGWAWLRPSVEYHSSGHHAAGAYSRSSRVRSAAYALSLESSRVPSGGTHKLIEWSPWGAGYRKMPVEVEVGNLESARQLSEAQRKKLLIDTCAKLLEEHGCGIGGGIADLVVTLPADELLLGLSLRLLSASPPFPTFEKKIIGALAATACVQAEVYARWRDSHGTGMWKGKRDISLINASAAFLAMLMAVNDMNDALGRPFPSQNLAIVSPFMAHHLAATPGGVLAGVDAAEIGRVEWKERLDRFMSVACSGVPSFVEGKRAVKKRRQQQSSGVKVGEAVKSSNLFSLLGEDISD